MITGFRITNLKAIGDSGFLPLVKINVLVGKNSAGKSSLLRLFPLLRQSVEQRTKGPILWYGRFVDFGNFQDVVNSKSPSKTIDFEFELSLSRTRRHYWSTPESFATYKNRMLSSGTFEKAKVRLTLGHGLADEVGRVKEVQLDLVEDRVAISFRLDGSVEGVTINSEAVKIDSSQGWHHRQGKLLPIPVLTRKETLTDPKGNDQLITIVEENAFGAEIVDALLSISHGNTTKERIAPIARQLAYLPKQDFYSQLLELPGLPPSFMHNVQALGAESHAILHIRKLVLLNGLSDLLSDADLQLESFANSVRYVEPVRAIAQRYYRLQDLAVDEIDSSGGNAAMYLNSLSAQEMQRLREWMLLTLGFYAEVEKSSGHVQVKIVGSGGSSKNIADLGFGFSQLLPIILQAWRASAGQSFAARGKERVDPLIAIEQPELHLHPQYQAQVADVLAAVVGAGRRRTTFFVETHSEHFINRLGQLVGSGKLKADDVQILVIEQQTPDLATVRRVGFDRKGFLDKQWPAGFFVPREV